MVKGKGQVEKGCEICVEEGSGEGYNLCGFVPADYTFQFLSILVK